MKKRILVTGAAGFLGRHIVQEFCAAGSPVLAIDLVAPEVAGFGDGVTYERMSLPGSHLEELLGRFEPEVFIHCAGRASVALSMEDPASDFTDGPHLTSQLLEALRRRAPKCRFIFLSSAAVYGNPPSLPVLESHPVAPLSPYGYHKRLCELVVEEYARIFGIASCAVRIFSAYGAGLRRQVVWDICDRALKTGRLVLRGTGAESRDFIHARDIARAVALLSEKAPANGEVYNLATGREATIAEIATILLGHLGLDLRPEFDGIRPKGDPANWRADISRIRELGFEPVVGLEEGMAEVARACLSQHQDASAPARK